MKFLYYSTAYYASHGGSIQSIQFYRHLNENGQVKELKIFPETSKKVLFRSKNLFLRNLLKKSSVLQIIFFYRKNAMYLKKLKQFIEDEKPDVLMIQIDSNFLQIKKIKSKYPNLLVCTQINASPFDEPFKNIALKGYFKKKQSQEYCAADMNFFISDFLRHEIMGSSLDQRRDKVVHNGTDVEKFKPLEHNQKLRSKYDYPEQEVLIGYIGTLDYHKKIEILLKAFAKVSLKFQSLKLIIIGDGPSLKTNKDEAVRLGIEEKVIFKGWVSHDHINEHLNCFDVAIHHHANAYMSPLKIFEYLAVGLPVIAPDIPAVKEIFTDGEELKLTGPTVEEVSKNLLEILHDLDEARLMGNRGGKAIRENYTWHLYTSKILELIQPITTEKVDSVELKEKD